MNKKQNQETATDRERESARNNFYDEIGLCNF